MKERLQKVMARRGYGSRRACEEMIRTGRVLVNGAEPSLGVKVDPARDEILIDGQLMHDREALVYIMLHKPAGYLSSTASQGGVPTVLDLVPAGERIYPVGRLDLDSEGLILLTNDGRITHILTHPSFEHEKEYRVVLDQQPTPEQLSNWQQGVVLADGYRTQSVRIDLIGEGEGGYQVRIIMTEGRKRQIRETANALGLQVLRLVRVRMANLQLGDLPSGQWRRLEPEELNALMRKLGQSG
ncbi:MAG: pseudouridine synthase [Anaerolineales bacterium]|jgi:23S rRNA pseudouridine2605 synthase